MQWSYLQAAHEDDHLLMQQYSPDAKRSMDDLLAARDAYNADAFWQQRNPAEPPPAACGAAAFPPRADSGLGFDDEETRSNEILAQPDATRHQDTTNGEMTFETVASYWLLLTHFSQTMRYSTSSSTPTAPAPRRSG